jgi:hypothetical protein
LGLPAAGDVERADRSNAGGVRQSGPARLVLGRSPDARRGAAGTRCRGYSARHGGYRNGYGHRLCENPPSSAW